MRRRACVRRLDTNEREQLWVTDGTVAGLALLTAIRDGIACSAASLPVGNLMQ